MVILSFSVYSGGEGYEDVFTGKEANKKITRFTG
jgi:hypothetical protein